MTQFLYFCKLRVTVQKLISTKGNHVLKIEILPPIKQSSHQGPICWNVELSETEASGGGRGMSPRRRGGYRIGREGDDRWREAKRGTAREKLEETERLKYRERVSQRDVVKQKDV